MSAVSLHIYRYKGTHSVLLLTRFADDTGTTSPARSSAPFRALIFSGSSGDVPAITEERAQEPKES